MTVADWIETQFAALTPDQRARTWGLISDLEARQIDADERAAIVDESRRAEARARNTAPDKVAQWIKDMYHDPERMSIDLRGPDADSAARAIFTTHLCQPSKSLDEVIERYARPLPVDASRRIFRKVPA